MSSPLSHSELFDIYPVDLRTDLVDWATDKRKPAGWIPPQHVLDHLVRGFEQAYAAGQRRAVVTALLVCWLPALCMVALAVFSSGGRP